MINTINSQTKDQEQKIRQWFNDYAVCSCITQAYHLKGIKMEDKSILFWNKKLPISSNNVEIIESLISCYAKKTIITDDLILKNCIQIKDDKTFQDIVSKFIQSDRTLQSIKYELPR